MPSLKMMLSWDSTFDASSEALPMTSHGKLSSKLPLSKRSDLEVLFVDFGSKQ